jgi:acetylornithine deacetylase/succinyl-diaminopimelate desuccinylase-like protein
MSDFRNSALHYAQDHRDRFIAEFKDFVSIASVSTDPQCKPEIEEAAEWVAGQLRGLGLAGVGIYPTRGHPVVYGESLTAGLNAPTVLVYGHYDVQPPDPLELWQSDPFKPDLRDDNLYGRGAADMKGQVLASIKALEAVIKTGGLPINVKFLIEGEEEIGSPNLEKFIIDNKDLLACDFALNPDTGMLGPDLPTITYALRGLAYFELRVFGPERDLHSGIYGGVVHNPAQALCELIAGMHDGQGRVTLPGFYARVRQLEEEERGELARLPTDEVFYLEQTGAPILWGEVGYSPTERVGARPTLEVNGLYSGFTGEGAKTVLPAWAMAKISTRLVPEQDPDEVYQQMKEYIKINAPETIHVELTQLTGGPASISNRTSQSVKAMEDAMYSVWGKRPLFRREGGSVPVVTLFKNILGVESVNCGFSLPDDHLHGPNEKQHLPTWYKGIDSLIHFYLNLGENTPLE